MSRILGFSDIHIHPHKKKFERLCDCLAALEWVFDTALENEIEEIVFAGDLFQDREKIDVMTYHMTFNVLEKYLNGKIKLYLLLGNHDLWYHDRWDINSVKPFSALPGVTVIDRPSTLAVAGVDVDFLPYTHTPIDNLNELRAVATKRRGQRTLFAHLAVHGAQLNTLYHTHSDVIIEHDGEMKKVDATVFHGWDQVFLGHYHGEQKISANAEYIGSPLQLSFGEAFQHKHVILYDLKSGSKKYVQNKKSPQHFIIKESEVAKYDVKNNYVQVYTEDLNETHISDIRRDLEKQSPANIEVIPVPKQDTQKLIADCQAIFLNEEEMMKRWMEEAGVGDLDRDYCFEKGKEVCHHQIAS
jgi:DNA repair exonuclease SbcCD nuclease subunit